jgi:uncharacterized membrane protein
MNHLMLILAMIFFCIGAPAWFLAIWLQHRHRKRQDEVDARLTTAMATRRR